MSDGMGRELAYLSSHATNRYFIPNWGIYWAEFEADENICLLSFDTESAWSACEEFFDELNNVLGGELSISYREIECGCDIFYVHDEQGFFPEECCVSSSGEPFEEAWEDVFDTCQDAITNWCEKMGISQGDRTDDEMVDFINGYEYENVDTYLLYTPVRDKIAISCM